MKKSVLLIGVGRFGKHIASQLKQLHHEVLAIDRLLHVHHVVYRQNSYYEMELMR